MNVVIAVDDLSDGQVAELLESHLSEMHKYSPVESIHALDKEKLQDPAMTFWSASVNGKLAGCGALKEMHSASGEIKSMKTSTDFLRQGIAEKILLAIIAEAKNRQYKRLYLETGSHDAFLPAIWLYEKHGFNESKPFGNYKLDPYSKFFCKTL